MWKSSVGLMVLAVAALALTQSVVAQDAGKKAEADPSGIWVGSADSPDGPVPFTLTLAVSGETVNGDINSAPIKDGSWKDGRLTFSFTYSDGAPVSMSGWLEDGRLLGSYVYGGGEASGGWSASRKVQQ